MELCMKKTFTVTGMACKHCASKVCTKAASLNGVKKASVDLTAGTLTVEFDDTVVGAEKIAEAVTAAGFPTTEQSL